VELLPDVVERSHLVEQLAELLRAEGDKTFLAGPLIAPTDEWFPDRWTPDASGVERLIRRLLGYAELGALTLTLEIDQFSDAHGEVLADGRAGGHSGTAAWFAGIRKGVCSFGVDTNQLRDPVGLVGTLAHEVAHAYRSMYELRVPDAAREEWLTDLTTVFLGFGVLTVNASQRFRSGSSGPGRSWYSRAEGGYLSMQSMSYLLAAQIVARGDSPRPVGLALAANQRACFKAAYKELGARDALLRRLGLAPRASGPSSSATAERGWFRRWFGS
jgi:hypothetical protein